MKNLEVPKGRIDVVLDTDAYNEIDDQFAIAYLLLSKEKLNPKAIYAAPFFNERSESPKAGMEKSYEEILKITRLMHSDVEVFKGSDSYLADDKTPVKSDAAYDLAKRAMEYTPEKPLYVAAIGAITNIASAILINPEIAKNIVVVWLGGHAHHFPLNDEFNMVQDCAAARVVMCSGAPFVQLPCEGIVRSFTISKPELEYWLKGKNKLADYLVETTVQVADSYAMGKPWTRVIWDVTAVAWLLNDNNIFMESSVIDLKMPKDGGQYIDGPENMVQRYVYHIYRDNLMEDMINKIAEFEDK